MEFFPRFLALKFIYFESISIPKLFLLLFGAFAVTAIISTLVGEYIASILTPIMGSLILLAFAGAVSAQHFARKPWVPTSPLIVQLTSKTWFNSILSLLSSLRHWGVLLFVNLALIMVVFIIIAATMQQFGS